MIFKLRRRYSPYLQLISAILNLIIAILTIINYNFLWEKIYEITLILLITYTIVNIFRFDEANNKLNISITLNVFLSVFAIMFILIWPKIFISIFPFVFGIYIFLQAIIRFIKLFIFFKDRLNYRYLVLLEASITLIFSSILLFDDNKKFIYLSYYLATYLIFYALSDFLKAFNKIFFASDARFAMAVPIFVAAILPRNTLNDIDTLIKNTKEDKKNDLEVFIYLRKGVFGQFGHVDFSYKGLTYSYGSFDPHSQKLMGGYGEGVLIVCERDKFLKHGNVFKQATIVKYGLKLNEAQKLLIDERINELMSNTYRFYCDAEIDDRNGIKKEYDTYLSNLYANTKAKTYKFKSGKFKTYFVLTTNCVNVADYVIHMKNLDIINIKGIITPGTYLSYLNDEYLSDSKIVESRYVYEK